MVVVNYPNSVGIISFSCNVVIFSKNSYGSINSFFRFTNFFSYFLVVILLSAFIAANMAPSVLDIFFNSSVDINYVQEFFANIIGE